MKVSKTGIGRLALRVEGGFWNTYWAPRQDSMEDVVLLGSLRMSLATHAGIKAQFMDLMRAVFSVAVLDATGHSPSWGNAEPAPEHERSGSA